MTLDISQFITNSVRTQSKIHHLDINVKAVGVNEIPSSVKKLITNDYGEKYLEDSDYVAFFWGPINKDNISKLFNTVDKALGKSANKLTDKDFKKINMNGADDQSSDEDAEDSEDVEDTEEIEDVEDIEDNDSDEESDEESDDSEEDIEIDDSDEEQINEDEKEEIGFEEEIETDDEDDDDEDDDDEDDDDEVKDTAEEKPEIPTSYFFLKITSK